MNKTILVIGASGGIGSQVAKDLINEGYSVIGTYSNTPINNPDVKSINLDFLSKDSIQNFVDKIKSMDTNLYAIINCAGIVEYENKNIEEDLKIWDKTIAVNLTSNYVLAKYFEDRIEEHGRFIMISSTDAMFGGSITVSYAVSKAGVNSLVKSFSLLFKDKKVSVNAIAPGWVNTKMNEDIGDDFVQKVKNLIPQNRIAEPKDISNIVTFLLKPEAGYINGQVITVDGGYTNQDPTLLIEEEIV
ncbi:MAG: SDR family NAD(P)-dependent oxidoreductase [Candidatus Dojkabacteria bacterium]|jgi:NAD(P)-dependent dehydrogenase (short-subunit alcohol dehydrogenase family)